MAREESINTFKSSGKSRKKIFKIKLDNIIGGVNCE